MWGVMILTVLLFALLFAGALTLTLGRAFPGWRRMRPERRSRALFLSAAAPWILGVIATGLAMAPSIGWAMGLHPNHCEEHQAALLHLCLIHEHSMALTARGYAFVGGAFAIAAFGASTLAWKVRIALRAQRIFWRISAPTGDPQVRRLDCERPVAHSSTAPRPVVFVSSGVLAALAPAERRALYAHEKAHLRRRDDWRMLAARALSCLYPPGFRRRLLGELDLAHEQSCDQAAARVVNRRHVASAIVKVEKLMAGAPPIGALGGSAFAASNIEARIYSLLDGDAFAQTPVWRKSFLVWGLSALLIMTAPLADFFHHLGELLLLTLIF